MSMTKENLIYMLTQIVNFFALNFQGVGGKVPPSPPTLWPVFSCEVLIRRNYNCFHSFK